jgi:hypothetical protein
MPRAANPGKRILGICHQFIALSRPHLYFVFSLKISRAEARKPNSALGRALDFSEKFQPENHPPAINRPRRSPALHRIPR